MLAPTERGQVRPGSPETRLLSAGTASSKAQRPTRWRASCSPGRDGRNPSNGRWIRWLPLLAADLGHLHGGERVP